MKDLFADQRAILFFVLAFAFTCACFLSSCAERPVGADIPLPKGPYLLYTGTTESMTVQWQTENTPTFSKIDWGSTTDYGNEVTTTENSSQPGDHQFSYTITGLTPGNKIYYKVSTQFWSYASYFWTPPDPSDTSLTFYAVGDTRVAISTFNQIASLIVKDMDVNGVHGTILLDAGDFATHGMDEGELESNYFFRDPPDVRTLLSRVPVMVTPGNQDCYYTDERTIGKPFCGGLLRKYWPYRFAPNSERSYYSFECGPLFVCVLDQFTAPGFATPPDHQQYNWATAEIAAATKPWKLVMFHEPAWSGRDKLYPTDEHGDHTEIQQYYQPVFVSSSVEVVVQGHAHMYAHCVTEEVHYVTTGGAGAFPLAPQLDAPCLVTASEKRQFTKYMISGDVMTVEAIDDTGAVIDRFEIER